MIFEGMWSLEVGGLYIQLDLRLRSSWTLKLGGLWKQDIFRSSCLKKHVVYGSRWSKEAGSI